MDGRIAFVEANTSGTGMMALRIAHDLGLSPLFLTAEPGRYQGLPACGAEVVRCDTGDLAALRAALEPYAGVLRGVTTTSDFYVAVVADLADALGLPGNRPEAVRTCRDKGRMRQALAAAGVRQPRFAIVRDPSETAAAVAGTGLPCVVKPVDGSGSENVRLCGSLAESTAQVERILAVQMNVRGQPAAGAALVEEYLEAPEFSVETFHVAGRATCVGVVAKSLTGHPHFVESGHVYPAPVDPLEGEAMVRAVRDALAATGMWLGPAHTEVKLLPDGVAIIEMNPRLAGGMIPELIRLVDGLDLVEQQLRAACGMPVVLTTCRGGYAGIRFLVASRPGQVRSVSGRREAAALQGVEGVVVSVAPGARVELPRNAYDRLGHVLARGRTVPELSARLDDALSKLRVEV